MTLPSNYFLKAKKTYSAHTPVQKYMRHILCNMLDKNTFEYIFEFGCGQGELTKMLIKQLMFKHYICNDINDYGLCFDDARIRVAIFDMNTFYAQKIYQYKFDLVASNACIQWLDFYKTIQNIIPSLNKNARLLIGTFGTQNLKEVRDITGFGLEYLCASDIKEILNEHFYIMAWHEEIIRLEFKSTMEIFRHLQKSGVNSLGATYLKKQWMHDYYHKYHNYLTYHPICIYAIKHGQN